MLRHHTLLPIVAVALALPIGPRAGAFQPAAGGRQPDARIVYPPAPTTDQADDYHGLRVADPYRWLEAPAETDPKVESWINAENEVTQAYLGPVPRREAIKARMTDLWNYERYSAPFKEGGKYFLTRNDGLQNQSPLFVLDSLGAEPRLLLDPNTLSKDGTVAIAGTAVTEDGKYLAYGLSDAGSDWTTWKVREIVTGKDLEDEVKWTKFAGAAWLKDGSGFFYGRFDEPKAGESLKGSNYYHKICFHARGTPQAQDPLIYGREDEKDWDFSPQVTDDGKYVVMHVSTGTDPKNRIFVRDLSAHPVAEQAAADAKVVEAEGAARAAMETMEKAAAGKAPPGVINAIKDWGDAARGRRAELLKGAGNTSRGFVELLNDFDATYHYIDNDGPLFWFLYKSDDARTPGHAAPRGRVIAIDLNAPARNDWRVIVPETEETIQGVSCVGGKFFVSYLKDAKTLVRAFDTAGKHIRDVELPGIGTAGGFGGKRNDPETFYSFTNFTAPGVVYRYDAATGKSEVFRKPTVKFSPEDYTTTQVFYTSKDGTRVPMFITAKKGMERTGNNPTLLYGYGGFNIPMTPSFSVANLQWLEMGAIYAVANLRGGGEYGEEWHQMGTKTHKQNVFDDFISAAEYLIKEKYTCTPKLAIFGGSNGGLLVGACITQRPDLFGAAIPAVGVLDMLRFNKFTVGHAWMSDYGNPDQNEAEFKALYAYSPYHNIKTGVCYPPTLITTGDHDDRVFPAHSFKFAAAMQAAQSQLKGCANPVLIRIETRAGHGAGKPTSKIIEERADMWAFLVRALHMTPTIPEATPATSN